jgi:hypothetical protein
MPRGVLALATLATCVSAGAARASFESSPWPSAGVIAENHRQCPKLDLTGITYGSWYSETDRAYQSLSRARQRVIRAENKTRCASETVGFTCETKVMFNFMDRWGLTRRHIAGMCRRYRRCRDEPAAC